MVSKPGSHSIKNKEWRMCVDYADLNKHCPKDPFDLPQIDEVVDSTTGCELLSFLDCFSSYHQISLKKRLYQKEEKHPGRWLKEVPAMV